MTDTPAGEPENFHEEIAELVRRALLQVGDMQEVKEKLEEIVERTSKITPPPDATPDA